MSLLVVLDMDSTLIQEEGIELLAAQVGVLDEVKAITDQAMAGELDFSNSLRQRLALLRGFPESEIPLVLERITVTQGARALIDSVHNSGGKVGVVSGGFAQLLAPLAAELELDFWNANHLEFVSGKFTGNVQGSIVDAAEKASSLNAWALECGPNLSRTVAIGDGANDIQMLEVADYAIAFRPKPALRPYADLVIEENSLLPVIDALALGPS